MTAQRLSREWCGTEQSMGDQAERTDPGEQYDPLDHTVLVMHMTVKPEARPGGEGHRREKHSEEDQGRTLQAR